MEEFKVEPFDLIEESFKKEENLDQERVWTVYVHIVPKEIRSSPDRDDYYDKYYVGITSKTTKKRWGKDGNGYNEQLFGNAIKKYGWDNILHEIIAEHLTCFEASDMERTLINKLQSDKQYGYNVSSGGILPGTNTCEDITGKQFGRWTVLKQDPEDNDYWICQCSCEEKTIKSVCYYSLIRGKSTSCGCYNLERVLETQTKHDMSGTPLYYSWQHIKGSCLNPNDKNYKINGLIGIKICDEWKNDFQKFYDWSISNGYEDGLIIDRIDKSKDWEPTNCQWLTLKEKANRKSDNVFYTYKGKTQNLADWSKELNIGRLTLYERIKRGMSIEEAFEAPTTGPNSPSEKRIKKHEYNGELHSLREWAELYNIDQKKLSNRISRDKWSMQKALDYYLNGGD